MRCDERRLLPVLLALALVLTPCTLARLAQAATVTVVNLDGPGEGFNDPTPANPVGGNPGVTIGAQRRIAFQFAADLWGTSLDSPVEVRVGAEFDPLPCDAASAVLGGAGPEGVFRDFVGAPVANTWFPVALANSLAGQDLDPGHDDIGATFNSSLGTTCAFPGGWYYGLDNLPPDGLTDFVSVLLHEMGHGLGFLTFVNLTTGAKLGGRNDAFMLNLEDHATGKLYPDMTNAERVAASTAAGDLHWVGPHVVAASGFLTDGRDPSGHVEMYAPFPQEPGSSVSHFSTALSPNELMEPFYTGPTHNRELTSELFADIGWRLLQSPQGHWMPLPIGGATIAGPAATLYQGELNLVVRGTDDGIYHTRQVGGVWTGWTPLGGLTPSEPAAVEFNGELWAFVPGTDARIYANRFNGASWSGWGEVPGGGLTLSGPGAAAFNSELYLFVRGIDNKIYHNRLMAGGWTGWAGVPGGGVTPAGPAAVVFESTLYLGVRGSDDRIYDNLLTLAGWTGWTEVPGGGLTPSKPAATVFGGQLWYFVQGTNARVYQNRLTAGAGGIWTGWSEVAGNGLTPSGPGAAAAGNALYLVVRGIDNRVYINQSNGG